MARSSGNEDEDIWEKKDGTPEKTGGFQTGFLAGVLFTLICVLVFMTGWIAGKKGFFQKQSPDENTVQGVSVLTDAGTLSKLDEIQSLIEQNYLGEVDSELLSAYLFKGIAAGLQDTYANYYTPKELQSMLDSNRGEYYGIGAAISENTKTKELRVKEVYDNSPASRSGLKTGDILIRLDETSLTDCGLSEAVALIKSRDAPFLLEIYRPATEETLELEMECSEVELEHVQARMEENGIGYLRILEFSESAVKQFKTAVEELQAQGMEKLIVDLRDNPGGLLNSVCDILDEILPEGLIVYTEDRNGNREERKADNKRSVTCEVAVLVNENSASASEIFAGAIQDYEIGPVIGTTTYGKGVVQKTYSLTDGSAVKFTVQKYYTPKGQDIDGFGITPDIIVEEADDGAQEQSADEGEQTGAEQSADEEEQTGAEQSADEEEQTGAEQSADEQGQSGTEQPAKEQERTGAEQQTDAAGEMQKDDPVLEKALEVLGSQGSEVKRSGQ